MVQHFRHRGSFSKIICLAWIIMTCLLHIGMWRALFVRIWNSLCSGLSKIYSIICYLYYSTTDQNLIHNKIRKFRFKFGNDFVVVALVMQRVKKLVFQLLVEFCMLWAIFDVNTKCSLPYINWEATLWVVTTFSPKNTLSRDQTKSQGESDGKEGWQNLQPFLFIVLIIHSQPDNYKISQAEIRLYIFYLRYISGWLRRTNVLLNFSRQSGVHIVRNILSKAINYRQSGRNVDR